MSIMWNFKHKKERDELEAFKEKRIQTEKELRAYIDEFMGEIPRDDGHTAEIEGETRIMEERLKDLQTENKWIRASIQDDMNERKHAAENLFVKLSHMDKSSIVIRPVSLASAQRIMEAGGLFVSTDERCDYGKTIYSSPKIFVEKIPDTQEALGKKIDICFESDFIPAGCVFVFKPTNKVTENTYTNNCHTTEIDFVKHPEQLLTIVTTKENLPLLQQWLEEKGLNPDIAQSFDGMENIRERFPMHDEDEMCR